MQRIKGIIHQLYTQGRYDEADQLIETLPTLHMTYYDDDNHVDTYDASTNHSDSSWQFGKVQQFPAVEPRLHMTHIFIPLYKALHHALKPMLQQF